MGNKDSHKAQPIKVVQLCTLDFAGAGNAAYRLHKGLQDLGIESTLIVAKKQKKDPTVHTLYRTAQGQTLAVEDLPAGAPDLWQELVVYWHNLTQDYPGQLAEADLFSGPRANIDLKQIPAIAQADLIHLHWVAGVMDYREAPLVFYGKPIVWTLHDMNPFTGGCHYALECTRYQERCGACPQLGSSQPLDISRQIWEEKHQAYQALDLHLVTPSSWLKECAGKSSLVGRFPCQVIPNGFPLEIFAPQSKKQARTELKIPLDKKVILFGAAAVNYPRKGFPYLREALNHLPDGENYVLISFGSVPNIQHLALNIRARHFGAISEQSKLAKIYAAADVYVTPTLADNLPNTIAEAMGCGTPVVGFASGGVKDMIDHQRTGFLVKPKDINGLIQGIIWVTASQERISSLGEACRKKALQFYAQEVQARSYLQLYKKLLEEKQGKEQGIRPEEVISTGETFFAQGNLNAAQAAFCHGLQLFPDHPTLLNNLGVVLWQKNEPDKALDTFQRAVQIHPQDQDSVSNLANILSSLGKITQAQKLLEDHLVNYPEHVELKDMLHKFRNSDLARKVEQTKEQDHARTPNQS